MMIYIIMPSLSPIYTQPSNILHPETCLRKIINYHDPGFKYRPIHDYVILHVTSGIYHSLLATYFIAGVDKS